MFFSRCTLSCLYCQNYPWSQGGLGRAMSAEGLAGILRDLAAGGCHNWNLVSPTPWLPWIEQAVRQVRSEGCNLPVVYNTSGFERPETLRRFADIVDVYLTDLRYSRAESALEGSGNGRYAEIARQALLEMWRLKGRLRTDGNGVALSGVVCRILVLPGKAQEAVENLAWIADNLGTDVHVSIMNQYIPANKATVPPWNRRITREEYDLVVKTAERLGLVSGWIQDMEADTPCGLVGFEMSAGPGF